VGFPTHADGRSYGREIQRERTEGRQDQRRRPRPAGSAERSARSNPTRG
jgi:hypothetical protein